MHGSWAGQVLAAYFASPEAGGHGYTMGRVPINSCDFDLETYNFAQVANDTLLEHFDREVTHDRRQLIPFIQSAMRVAAQHNSTVELIGSPWSPPAWMKVRSARGPRVLQGIDVRNALYSAPTDKGAMPALCGRLDVR